MIDTSDVCMYIFVLLCTHYVIVQSSPTPQSPISINAAVKRNALSGIVACLTVSTAVCSIQSSKAASLPSPPTTTSINSVITTNKTSTHNSNAFINGLISGSVSRASKEVILHPIDTVRARQQISSSDKVELGLINLDIQSNLANISSIAYNNSILYANLFDGLYPALIAGIPAGAVFFAVKDGSKEALRQIGLSKELITIISVIMANIPYWLIRTPGEVVKTRQQIGDDSRNQSSMSVFDSIGLLYDKSFRDSYINSYLSNVLYSIPVDVIKFLVYDYLSHRLFTSTSNSGKIEGFDAAVAGALASLVVQIAATPLDVLRTRVMLKPSSSSSNSGSKNIITVYKELMQTEGLIALSNGIVPRAARALVSGAIQSTSYELVQNFLNK